MKKMLSAGFILLAITLLASASAMAQEATYDIDYVGFGWETGGLLPSDPGDVLCITTVADGIDPVFGIDLFSSEVTIYIHGLTSVGEFTDPGTGWINISYIGGHIEVYEDAAMDYDWGINPPNAELATFTNGTLLFEGDFIDFYLLLTPEGAGFYEGNIDGIGGTIADTCADCAYTFGGAFTRETGAQIPEGYDLQIDGILEVLESVPTADSSWGSVKALY